MARWLKQSTSVDVPIGPFLDATDGVTAETGLTITQPDIRLKKNGGAWAQKAAAQTLTHEENGYYEVTLDATDTNTLGLMRLAVAESGALPVWEEFLIVPANVWDSFFGADLLQVDETQILGDGQSATDLKDFADTGYDPGTNKVQGVVLTDTLTTYTGDTPQTGDSFARLGAPAGASIAADLVVIDDFVDNIESRLGTPSDLGGGATVAANLADIEAQTDDIGVAGAGLTAINLPDQTMNITGDITGNLSGSVGSVSGAVGSVTGAVGSVTGAVGSVAGNVDGNVTGSVGSLATQAKADVNAEVDTAIADARLDELLAADSDIDGLAPPTVGSVVHELMSKTAGSFTFDQTTDSLEALRDNTGTAGAGLTDLGGMSTTMKAQVETEVDDALGSGTGAALTAIPWNAAWDAEVESEVDDALGAGTGTALTAVPWNASWDAEVQSEVADALAAFGSFGVKKNTAKAGFPFLMTDDTNHVPTTGYTVTAERMIDGGAFAACANAVVEDTAGWYHIDLAAADLNGDTVALKFTATGADALNIAIVTSP